MEGIKSLGSGKTEYKYDEPTADMLEVFENKYADYLISMKTYEFTSMCPVTGQPDYATIIIQYIPGNRCIESKSLKLYLGAYREHGMFHEMCVNKILEDCKTVCEPKYMRVIGDFAPRGGISIVPVAEYKAVKFYVSRHILEMPQLHKTHSHI